MNDARTVDQLERSLKEAEPELLRADRLSEIRARGRRRRQARLTAIVAGAAAVIAAASVGVAAVTGGDGGRSDTPVASDEPKQMSALAKRALAEIPGAVQVSSWQVVIPLPAEARPEYGSQAVPADHVQAGPIDLGTRRYIGVTAFRQKDFPAWLYNGIADYEKTELGDDEGYPVGSTDIGVIVDAGQLRLACMTSLPEWEGDESAPCFPAMLSGEDGALAYEWGMGTDDFLEPGADLELFHTQDYSTGALRTVWVGGTDGTEVASVDLVTTAGETVSATVAPGTFRPGDTIFWGTVDGELARAVTRDADGNVLEDHELKPCKDPVDCEVR